MKIDSAKLAAVEARMDAIGERIDYWLSERLPAPAVMRRADKTWDESKHPRGPDGKFIEGEGAAAASAAEYLSQQQKAGKKPTPNGMMQHLLMNGGITKNEIWDTTKANFEMAPHLNNYVSAVLATLKKKGIDVPEPPKAKKGGDKPTVEKKEDKPAAEDKPQQTLKEEAVESWKKSIAEAKDAADIQDTAAGIDYAQGKGYITGEQAEMLKKELQAKGAELKAAASGNAGEVAAWEKMIDVTTEPSDFPELMQDLQFALGKKTLTQGEFEALKGKMNAKAQELWAKKSPAAAMKEALAALPKPANTQEDDIAWMANTTTYSPEEKLKYIEEMKIAPSSKPYKEAAIAAVKLGLGQAAAPAASAPAPGAVLPKAKTSSVAQGDMYAIAADPSITTENKIAQLTAKHDNLTLPENKAYAAKLIEALGGQAPSAAPPPPPPKPIAQTQALQGELAGLKEKWKGVLAQNKPPVDAIAQQLDSALGLPSADAQAQALAKITPIPNPIGMGQKSANDFLAKAQQAAGITPTTPGHPSNAPLSSSLPKGPGKKLQAEIFHALEDSPAVYIESAAKFEGANGKIKARNIIDTDKIPKDEYAKVTAAYGADRDNGMTQAVDTAMREYSKHSFDKLDAATQAAVASYQGTGYGSINGALLAGGEGAGKTKEEIQMIKKAIENSAVPADTPAFRGMRCSLKDLSGFDDPAKSVGRAFVHKNFASISRSEAKARDFGEEVMLKMTIPAGTRGLVMGKQDWEREIMLQANSVFRIDKVEQKVTGSGKAQHFVHVTYMGTKEDG